MWYVAEKNGTVLASFINDEAMSTIEDLDDTRKVITASSWRFLCMGSNSRNPSKPGGSNRDWAEYRKIVGMVDDDLEPNKKRDLTRRQAFLLLVLGRLSHICKQIDRPEPKRTAIDLISLIEIADEWAATIGRPMEDAFKVLASVDGEIPGSRLEEVIQDWVGKPLSRRQIYRICDSVGVKFGTKRNYTPTQLQKIYRRVVTG